jgi:glucokinase
VNAPVAGLYRVSYTFVADLASGTASVIVDPVAVTNMVETAVIGAGTGFGVSGSMPVNLAAGAHVQLSCFTSVAGSLSYCTLTLERLR